MAARVSRDRGSGESDGVPVLRLKRNRWDESFLEGLKHLLFGGAIHEAIVANDLSENDLLNYIESTVTEKLPKSKGKKPCEAAGSGQPKTARPSGSKKPE